MQTTQLNLNVHIYEPVGGDARGPMARVLNERDRIKQNLIAILFTLRGEWPGKPWLGFDLTHLLYEPADVLTLRTARAAVEGQIRRYEPHLGNIRAAVAYAENEDGMTGLRIDVRGTMLRTRDIFSATITVER